MTISINTVSVSSPPWVDLYISVLPATTVYVHVTRTWAGVSERVRGDSTTAVLGTDTRVVDWAAPVGTGMIGYLVEAFTAGGVLLETASTTATATTIGDCEVWLSDPHDPTGAVLAALLRGNPEQSWDAPGSEAVTTMTGLPLGLDASRSWRVRNWQLRTDTDTDAALAAEVLGSSTVLLRGDPAVIDDPTGVLYVMASGLGRMRYAAESPSVIWSFSGPAIRGPQAPPAVSARTYQDDLDEDPTYSASLASFATYLLRVRG